MENRHGLVVDACLTQASGQAERLAALAIIERRADRPGSVTLDADKGYDAADFVNELRAMNVRPHVSAPCSWATRIGRCLQVHASSFGGTLIKSRKHTLSIIYVKLQPNIY